MEGVLICASGAEKPRNSDTDYPFRVDSHFFYLTGFAEPDSVLVVQMGPQPKTVLFCPPRDPEKEQWQGRRLGPERAVEGLGVDEAYPNTELAQRLPGLLAGQAAVLFSFADAALEQQIKAAMQVLYGQARAGVEAPCTWVDARQLLNEWRLHKTAAEIQCLRQAAEISAAGHRRIMQNLRPGWMEYQAEAEFVHECMRLGARHMAYPPIVAGGENACILHYTANNALLRAGDLLLVDAGCEWNHYAADITRTMPVSGRFSAPQQALYELVLQAQTAAIAQVQVGQPWNAPHDAAVAVLTQGLLDLGLLQGSLAENIEQSHYRRFYMHRTGHWLGLDVHDVGDYKQQGQWRPLAEGMVCTVEPGLYIPAAPDVPEAYWHIGIRIEDDVLVTAQGPAVLTEAAPKTVADLHAIMGQA